MADVQMKGITCCTDCTYYSMKKHKCTRGHKEEGKATDHFYKDCPLPDVRPVVRGRWTLSYDKWTLTKKCSSCGSHFWQFAMKEVGVGDKVAPVLDFCPSCGADMREVSDE